MGVTRQTNLNLKLRLNLQRQNFFYDILQAYKSHELYAIEKWLHKNQILHPKGPVLGFCSGHPVYPRTCVQTLRTKERWLRDGLQLKANEVPVKVSVLILSLMIYL